MAKVVPQPQILRKDQVCQLTGLGKTSIYEMARAGQFPRPIELGARARGWLRAEIEQWIEERRQARDSKA